MNGYGKLVQNGSTYEGEFKNGKQEGEGKEIWNDGAFYEGHYEHGLRNGKGKFTWQEGTTYEGGF